MEESRRRFIAGFGSLVTASYFLKPRLGGAAGLSYLDGAPTAAPSRIRFGYAAITWDGNDTQAIEDISAVGFPGIQLRSSILKDFGDKPKALADLLRQHSLEFVALSGGGPRGNSYDEAEAVATQVKHAKFMKDCGGLYLQMTDSTRPKDRKPAAEDFKKLGRLLTQVGKRTADLGIRLAYHNHMGSLGEAPPDVDAIMDASDPKYVKLLLDVAHYAQGGGDPAKAIRTYRDRILFLHIKDVETIAGTAAPSYRFVELGRGRVDLPGVFQALKDINFRGWAVVELDRVPDKARTPKESAIINKKYIEEKVGLKV